MNSKKYIIFGNVEFSSVGRRFNYGYDWAIEVREKVNSFLLDGNYNPLIQYEKQSKAFQLAIPTPDHYIPLLYILGLQQKNEQLSLFNDKLVAGSLSMTSVKIG